MEAATSEGGEVCKSEVAGNLYPSANTDLMDTHVPSNDADPSAGTFVDFCV